MRPWTIAAVSSLVLVLGGCGVQEGLIGMRDQATQIRAQIEADRAALVESSRSLPEGDPVRSRLEALAAERAVQSRAVDRTIERLDGLISSAQSGDAAGAVEGGAGLVSPLLPPGARLPVLLAGGLLAALWRAAVLKRSAASIAEGLEKAMRDDDKLREGLRRNAATLRAVQTRTAGRIVDEATKPGPMLRLPV